MYHWMKQTHVPLLLGWCFGDPWLPLPRAEKSLGGKHGGEGCGSGQGSDGFVGRSGSGAVDPQVPVRLKKFQGAVIT